MQGSQVDADSRYLSQKWLLTIVMGVLLAIMSAIAGFYHQMIMGQSQAVTTLQSQSAYWSTQIIDLKERHKEQIKDVHTAIQSMEKDIIELKRELMELQLELERRFPNPTKGPGP